MAAAFVLDRASILERLGGDEEIYAMMVDMFVADVENNCTALATALAAGDVESLKRAAHTVKGLLATFSDDDGAVEANFVEKTPGKTNSPTWAPPLRIFSPACVKCLPF